MGFRISWGDQSRTIEHTDNNNRNDRAGRGRDRGAARRADRFENADASLFRRHHQGGPVIRTGSGDDTVRIGDDFNRGGLYTGRGDDSVRVGDDMNGGVIGTGRGDDRVNIVDDMNGGVIHTGRGDDDVLIDDNLNGGRIYTGSGDDWVDVDAAVGVAV
ncbi:MAG: hypothetical protein AAF772_21655, partial [Acidobacteriota bacterium]